VHVLSHRAKGGSASVGRGWIVRRALCLALAVATLLGDRTARAATANDDCPAADNRSWVQGDGECLYIQTFDRDKTASAPTLLVFLHGDKSNGRPISWEMRYASQFASRDVVAVTMVRPGYPAEDGNRSTGDTTRFDNYTDHNISAVAGALRRLKEYHSAQRLVLVGYSGAAAMAGVIIGKFPGLVNVAVLVACPCDIAAWRGRGGWGKSLSPSDFIRGIPAGTTVLALTGQRDTNTREQLAREYVARLKARKIAAEFRQILEADHDTTPNKPATVNAIRELLEP
jgi:predicted esterase